MHDVLPAFTPLPFSANYLSALEEMYADGERAGHTDAGTRNLLFSLVLDVLPEKVVEVGGHIGLSSLVMGEALRLNGRGKLYTIEPQPHYLERLRYYTSKASLEDFIEVIPGYSHDTAVKSTIEAVAPLDLVYVDACHDYLEARHDITYFSRLLRQNGVMVLHDTSVWARDWDTTKKGGVRRALIEATIPGNNLQLVFFEHSYWPNACGAAMIVKQERFKT